MKKMRRSLIWLLCVLLTLSTGTTAFAAPPVSGQGTDAGVGSGSFQTALSAEDVLNAG